LASAYATAYMLPNLFRRLLAEGGMTAAFIPTLNDEMAKRQREGAFGLVSQVASWLLAVSAAIVLVAMLVLSRQSWIVGLCRALHEDQATLDRMLLAARLTVFLFPYLIFVCLAAAFSAALQTLNRFLEPALSPIWLNVCIIGLLAAGKMYSPEDHTAQMNWLCAGALLGGFFQMIVPAWALTREGWRPRFDLRSSSQVCAIVKLMGPTVLGSAIYLINMSVSRLVGLSLNDAAVSVLNYATRLMELPIGVFAVAVSTVVFPLISRFAALGDFDQLGIAYRKGMRFILMINVPAAVGLTLLAEPVIRLLLQRGEFHAGDTSQTTPVLVVYAIGLPVFSFVNLVLRAFYAQKDTLTPVRAAVLSFVVNLGLSIALMGRFSTVGLAVAGNVAILVQAWYLQVRLAKKIPQLALGHLFRDLSKILGASACMGLAVYGSWHGWSHLLAKTRMAELAGLGVTIGIGLAVYGALLWLFRIEGREELAALVRKVRARAA
jgi:putative peptidoglycan lipid II flippase